MLCGLCSNLSAQPRNELPELTGQPHKLFSSKEVALSADTAALLSAVVKRIELAAQHSSENGGNCLLPALMEQWSTLKLEEPNEVLMHALALLEHVNCISFPQV